MTLSSKASTWLELDGAFAEWHLEVEQKTPISEALIRMEAERFWKLIYPDMAVPQFSNGWLQGLKKDIMFSLAYSTKKQPQLTNSKLSSRSLVYNILFGTTTLRMSITAMKLASSGSLRLVEALLFRILVALMKRRLGLLLTSVAIQMVVIDSSHGILATQ